MQKYALRNSIFLLGWSLGGRIALEMAVILEAKSFKNAEVILLDTQLNNYSTIAEDQTPDGHDVEAFRNGMIGKYGVEYVNKLMTAILPNKNLAISPISGPLRHTKVTLFKAIQNNDLDQRDKWEMDHLDLVAANLRTIPVNCKHYNILEFGFRDITQHLLRRKH